MFNDVLLFENGYQPNLFYRLQYSATPAKRYEARENAGEIVLTYNPGGIPDKNLAWNQRQIVKVQNVELEPLTKKFKYMFQKIVHKSQGTIDFMNSQSL